MKRILAVEDDTDILETLSILLSGWGYQVYTSSSGKDTLDKINVLKPDLILLDIILDDVDGRDICLKVKSDEQTKHIPVIMISSHPYIFQSIPTYGANDVLPKPFEVGKLQERIERYLT